MFINFLPTLLSIEMFLTAIILSLSMLIWLMDGWSVSSPCLICLAGCIWAFPRSSFPSLGLQHNIQKHDLSHGVRCTNVLPLSVLMPTNICELFVPPLALSLNIDVVVPCFFVFIHIDVEAGYVFF